MRMHGRIPAAEGSYYKTPIEFQEMKLRQPVCWFEFSTAKRDLLGRLYVCNSVHPWPWWRRALEFLGLHRADTAVGPLFSRWPKKTDEGILFNGKASLKTRKLQRF